MTFRGLALAPPAKTVVVYRNGDPFCPGRKFVVNQRRFLTFEAFLNEVTKSIQAPLAVRNLYTPRHGRRVAGLGDLRDGCRYVAAGFEKFKKLNYFSHGQKELRRTRNSEGLQFHAVAPWKAMILGGWQTHAPLPCTIHVFRNGDLLSPPFPLPLSKDPPLQWDALLATLTEKAALRSGAVRKLCRLDGTPVASGEELVNGRYYVAVGNEEYKKLPYFELLVPRDSPRRTLWNHPNSRRGNYRQGVDSHRVQATGAAEKRKIPAAFPRLQRQGGKSRPGEEGSIFQPQPAHAGQDRRSNRNMQQGPDQEASIHKARNPRKEMRGAQRVEDERREVDAAVDQRAAEELGLKAKPIAHSKAQTMARSQETRKKRKDPRDSEDEKHQAMLSLAAESSEKFMTGV